MSLDHVLTLGAAPMGLITAIGRGAALETMRRPAPQRRGVAPEIVPRRALRSRLVVSQKAPAVRQAFRHDPRATGRICRAPARSGSWRPFHDSV